MEAQKLGKFPKVPAGKRWGWDVNPGGLNARRAQGMVVNE